MLHSLRVLLYASLLFAAVRGQQPLIRNLHARFDAQQDVIYVTWTAPFVKDDFQYQIKYRIVNRLAPDNEWQYKRTTDTDVQLDLHGLKNGDEVEVEVKSELDGGNRGQPLFINIVKQAQVNGMTLDEEELLPPLNFAANILDPHTVKLEWRPSDDNEDFFYIVNVKQLTPRSADNLLRQQIRVDGNDMLMYNLEPGQRYEFTVRTATSPDHASSTAAIVEITMPGDGEYFEVGNFLITSKFNLDGSGTVNLTWDVPEKVKDKIKGYHVEYKAANEGDWRTLYFDGRNPTIILNDMKSDTEYFLRIKTSLASGLETESGEFRFKTPKVPKNVIEKVDVIYSSETPDIRIQWKLKSEFDRTDIVGYEILINEDSHAPDHIWRQIEHRSNELSVAISGLRFRTTYFVRIAPKTSDGLIHRSSVVYKFKTLDEQPKRLTQRTHRKRDLRGRHRRSHYLKVHSCYENADCKAGQVCTFMEDGRWCLPRSLTVELLNKDIHILQHYVKT